MWIKCGSDGASLTLGQITQSTSGNLTLHYFKVNIVLLGSQNVHTLTFCCHDNNHFPLGFHLCDNTTLPQPLTALKPHSFIHVAVRLCHLDVRLSISPHAISLCLSEWTNNCTLYVFCCRGAGGTTGTTGRATMSSTAEWMTWCCSARSMRTPSWTTSRRDTWMTTSLYPFAHNRGSHPGEK